MVYTAIFGGYDQLSDPRIKPDGVDFVCFTDGDLKSDVWQIRKVPPLYDDATRSARKFKVLPHRWFPEYDVSIWIDGNKVLRGNTLNYLYQLGNDQLAVFDHMKCRDKWNCVYDEAKAILRQGKDDAGIVLSQIGRYRADGYPENNGQAFTCVVVRRHNASDVNRIMEDWWAEIKTGSKRDQLSLNFVCWKNNYDIKYLSGDGRNDGIITHRAHSN